MQSFTVHRRRRTIGHPEAEAEATVFVRDGFSWAAFIVPVLWALYHRMWVVLAGFVIVAVALNLAISASGLPEATNGIASIALQIMFGTEARDLRRWTLERRGYDIASVIVADNQDEAETRYFREWSQAIAEHQAKHAAGDNVAITFRARSEGPAEPAPDTGGAPA